MGVPRADAVADLVVVGFGAAGAAAAIEANRLGASVIVLERAPEGLEGGTSRASAQGFLSPVDEVATAEYLVGLAAGKSLAPGRVRDWSTMACQNAEWLRGFGVDSCELPAAQHQIAEYPELRGAWAVRKRRVIGTDLWSALSEAARQSGVSLRFGSRAVALVENVRGVIEGVVCTDLDGRRLIVAGRYGTVLASGGFAASRNMLRSLAPEFAACATAGSPYSTGDGISLAARSGARLVSVGTVAGPYLAFRAPGFKSTTPLVPMMSARHACFALVDVRGRVLSSPQNTRHGRVLEGGDWAYQRLPSAAYFVCDTDLLDEGPLVHASPGLPGWSRKVEGLTWSTDNQAEAEAGWVSEWPPPGLADAAGPSPAGRRVSRLHAVRLLPSILNTQGGPERDARGRVLSKMGTPIAGLFSAGELGSVFPQLYQGAGNLADCLVSGRLAAAAALRGGRG